MAKGQFVNRNYAQAMAAPSASVWKNAILPAALAFGGPAVLGAMGGGTAAGASVINGAPISATFGSSLPAAAGGGMGPLGWLKAGEIAAGTFGNIYGARKNQTANREALAAQQASTDQAMMFEREQMAEAKRQFDIQQSQLRAQWERDQAMQAQQFAATEDERLYQRKLLEDRETRRAPYRQASADALGRLPGILASGRTSPGLGSLGSYRRS